MAHNTPCAVLILPLSDMPVQDFPRCGQDAVWQNGKHLASQYRISSSVRRLPGGLRIAVVRQHPLGRAKLVLEGHQALIPNFRAPEIKAFRARRLAFLDQLPE